VQLQAVPDLRILCPHLESPTLATHSWLPRTSATHAVAPAGKHSAPTKQSNTNCSTDARRCVEVSMSYHGQVLLTPWVCWQTRAPASALRNVRGTCALASCCCAAPACGPLYAPCSSCRPYASTASAALGWRSSSWGCTPAAPTTTCCGHTMAVGDAKTCDTHSKPGCQQAVSPKDNGC
jgi:hypothetical protein